MSIITGIAVGALIVVALLVSLPVLYETSVTILASTVWPGIRQWPRILRTGKLVDSLSDGAEYGVVGMVLCFIGIPIYLHFFEFAPFFQSTVDESWFHFLVAHVLPSVWINSGMLFHFYLAVTLSPGVPMDQPDETGRKCEKCQRSKPPRAHHCSTCKTCVLQLDHHCPFTANCVGQDNYRHFFLFVLYAWIATMYALYLAYHPYKTCIADMDAGAELPDDHVCASWRTTKPRLFFLSVSSAVIVSIFLLFLLFLLFTGQTTLGLMYPAKRKELLDFYRPKGLWYNLQVRLGPASWWWVFLFPIWPLYRRIPPFVERLSL